MTHRRSRWWRQRIAAFNVAILVEIKLHKNLLIQHFIHITCRIHIGKDRPQDKVLNRKTCFCCFKSQ